MAAPRFHLLYHQILAFICWTLHAGMYINSLHGWFYKFFWKRALSMEFLAMAILWSFLKSVFLSIVVGCLGRAGWAITCEGSVGAKKTFCCCCCWCQVWHKDWTPDGDLQESGQTSTGWNHLQHLPLCEVRYQNQGSWGMLLFILSSPRRQQNLIKNIMQKWIRISFMQVFIAHSSFCSALRL